MYEALMIPFMGTKGPSSSPEKQPHNHKPYTLHNAVRQ